MKTNVEEINRNIYDIKNQDDYDFKMKKGLITWNNKRNIKTKKWSRMDGGI